MNLGPQFEPSFGDGLYHGTFRDIQGGRIVPAHKTTHQSINFAGLSSPDHAYATENEDTAWEMAQMAQRNHNNKAHTVPPRTRVYGLHPNEEMQTGAYHPDNEDFDSFTENLSEWKAPHFDIERRIDIKPGHQGTFNLNWNQFKGKNRTEVTFSDALNHPSDEDIEQGHSGSQMRNDYAKNFYDPEEAIKKRAEQRSLEGHPELFHPHPDMYRREQ